MDFVCLDCHAEVYEPENDACSNCLSPKLFPITYTNLSWLTDENLAAAGLVKKSTTTYEI